jgi:hypothetical protein
MQCQQVAEMVQRSQQLVPDVQQVGAHGRGHALQILLVILYAPLECWQRIERAHRHVRQAGARIFGTQHRFHKAVHLIVQRFVQLVGGFVFGVAACAPVVQLCRVQHFSHGAHYAVRAVFISISLIGSLSLMMVASLITAIS